MSYACRSLTMWFYVNSLVNSCMRRSSGEPSVSYPRSLISHHSDLGLTVFFACSLFLSLSASSHCHLSLRFHAQSSLTSWASRTDSARICLCFPPGVFSRLRWLVWVEIYFLVVYAGILLVQDVVVSEQSCCAVLLIVIWCAVDCIWYFNLVLLSVIFLSRYSLTVSMCFLHYIGVDCLHGWICDFFVSSSPYLFMLVFCFIAASSLPLLPARLVFFHLPLVIEMNVSHMLTICSQPTSFFHLRSVIGMNLSHVSFIG
jgi:hypothetical protein